MTAILDGLPLARLDQVVLAVHDLIHDDSLIRTRFGGRALAGTATIAALSTTLVGTGTSWESGDDSLGAGERLVLGDQVARIETVASDTELEIAVAHADGLTDEAISVASRGGRVQISDRALSRALPWWTVSAVAGEYNPAIGRVVTPTPQADLVFAYDLGDGRLEDDSPSWAGLLQHAADLVTANPRLCVPRFGNVPLVQGFDNAGPNFTEIPAGGEAAFPGLTFTWRGDAFKPAIAQRW